MSSSPSPLRCHRGSCICDAYELRITRRCLADDLHLQAKTDFSAALSHPIVKAFETQRSEIPSGGKTVGPTAGELTIYRLAYGHDHRGATWFDQRHGVVWLCAYGLHRSGEADDAFPYFHQLIEAGTIRPTEADYDALFRDRGHRFVETLPADAQALLAQARLHPGTEQIGILGGQETAGALVDVVETLEETYVAFFVARMDYTRVILILSAFYPQAIFGDWEQVSSLPTRALREAEVCYRILRT